MSKSLQKTDREGKDVSSRFEMARRSVRTKEGDRETCSVVLLLDVSGSMSDIISGKAKIDHLRDAVDPYLSEAPVISFHSIPVVDEIPDPTGTTRMDKAFELCRKMYSPSRIVLVSDGIPDYGCESEVRSIAVSMHIPVDVLYIGVGGDSGEKFMIELAHLTGGRQLTASTIGSNFGGLLSDGLKLLMDQTNGDSDVISL